MKALEFQSQLNSDHTLTVPPSVMAAIPIGQTLRVLILIPESDLDPEWEWLLTARDSPGDAGRDRSAVWKRVGAAPGANGIAPVARITPAGKNLMPARSASE
jgi:hypothetical protein